MLIHKIIEYSHDRAKQRKLKDIRIGLGYLGVELDDGSLGCAFVFRGELGPHCSVLKEAGNLIGKSAEELAQWADSEREILKASIGVAVLNALTDYKTIEDGENGDVLDYIKLQSEDRVGMIGYFKPIIDAAEIKSKELVVFERNITSDDPRIHPDWAESLMLPRCDVVIVSGTTLINKTIDQILGYCTNAREVAIVGPSTLMYPEAFKNSNATLLAGSKVDTAFKNMFFDIISQGGGGRELLSHFNKYTVRV